MPGIKLKIVTGNPQEILKIALTIKSYKSEITVISRRFSSIEKPKINKICRDTAFITTTKDSALYFAVLAP
jgi:hypothetical protein